MDCLNTLKLLGFECITLNEVVVLSSPISFSDGTPMAITLKPHNNGFILSDDGETLFALNANGMPMSDGRKFNYLVEHAKDFNLALNEQGAFFAFTPVEKANGVAANFLAFFNFIADWEKKSLAIGNEESSLIDKVISDLKRRFPSALIEARPDEVYGASGAAYRFDAKMDDRYVGIISAHSTATGAALRKIADLKKSGDDIEMLFILDDYKSRDKAEMESLIISSYCPTMLASSLDSMPVVH
ncbi:MAG: DUF1828 domain-containing protein [Thiomicrospira sp.]